MSREVPMRSLLVMMNAFVSFGSENKARFGEFPAKSRFSGQEIVPVLGGKLYRFDNCHLWFQYPQLLVRNARFRSGAFAWLQKSCSRNVQVQTYSALVLTTPEWKIARNHLLVAFHR
jgi:hypothetical protein